MNVVYVAYRRWAFDILRGLLTQNAKGVNITGVLTIQEYAKEISDISVPVFEIDPTKLDSKDAKKIISSLNPTVFLFYGWSWMIPEELYTTYPCLILHTSPLPKYRGGSPIQNQIIRGDYQSAVSIFQATEGIDEGPIFAQAPLSLEGTMDEIFDRIVDVGLRETKKVLTGMADKTLKPKLQDESQKTYFKRRKPSESELTLTDFQTKSARELYDFIRALGDPYPNAYIVCKDGKKLYLTGARIEKGD